MIRWSHTIPGSGGGGQLAMTECVKECQHWQMEGNSPKGGKPLIALCCAGKLE